MKERKDERDREIEVGKGNEREEGKQLMKERLTDIERRERGEAVKRGKIEKMKG